MARRHFQDESYWNEWNIFPANLILLYYITNFFKARSCILTALYNQKKIRLALLRFKSLLYW